MAQTSANRKRRRQTNANGLLLALLSAMVSAMHNRAAPQPAWKAYSPKTASEITELPVSQIFAAIRRGDLDAVRVGKHWRIADSSLRRFVGQDAAQEVA